MKRPEISADLSDPELAGSNETSSWVPGRNCVYRDSIAGYRVSIRTPRGWKSYGHFNDLETATYVANIAILAESCEEKYQLNEGIGEKNREELDNWRRQPGNLNLEKTAGERYKKVQADLAALREQEEARIAEERKQQEAAAAEKRRVHDDKVKMIYGLSNADLVKFLKNTKLHDPYYEIAMSEAVRRYNKLGIPRAT